METWKTLKKKKNQIKLVEMEVPCLRWKNTLGEMDGRLDITEEKINELKDTVIETIWNEAQRKKKLINEYIVSEMWDYFKTPI